MVETVAGLHPSETGSATERTPYLSAHQISKNYGAVRALSEVSIDLLPSEVHAIVGENGAGKSTLMKVLAGEERPDAGAIFVQGAPVRMLSPGDAQTHGIAVVHQHFPMVHGMTVAQNMHLGDPPLRGLPWPFRLIDHRRMVAQAQSQLRSFGLSAKAKWLVRDLSVAERQIVEIAKALSRRARLLILDEPTSSLNAAETAGLFEHIRDLRRQGATIVFIAHSIEEVLAIADRVTVLRDGRLIGTQPARDLDVDAVVRMMVGRDLAKGYPKVDARVGEAVLSADAVAIERHGPRWSLNLKRGEILGLPAYMGSGIDDLLAGISGQRRLVKGSLALDGHDVTRTSLRGRVLSGICFVPGDATEKGLIPKLTVEENILLPNLRNYCRFGLTQRRRARALCKDLIRLLDIRPPNPQATVEQLSGGNRQKVVIAKWLAAGAKVLVMDDPTKGVDVGAKVEIYHVIGDMVTKGSAVALASSDLHELIGLADRVVVIRDGAITAEFDQRPFDKANILARLAGVPREERPSLGNV
ncbi:MAG: sugar ABC transporter ATP-binding protein [Candidatus Rokubacteria bacterium]|nr:sugar ABC transporter ATP-binding protein [Candidatus Rokubacteria bacterium]